MQVVESRSLSLSIALHAAALIIAAFGLPVLLPERPEPTPLVMTVELLPVGEMTNVKPSDKPIEKAQKAPTPKTTKPVTPSAAEKSTPTPPTEEKHFDPTEDAPPDDSQKPKDKPREKDTPKTTDDFAALLNKLKQEAKTDTSKDATDKTNAQENKTRSDAPYDDSLPLSIREKDMIRNQFLLCWRMPAGAKDAHTLIVTLKLELQADGTVLKAELAPEQRVRYASDSFFRAAADSAIRATHQCSPLKNLPPDKYGAWRKMELVFNPQDLL